MTNADVLVQRALRRNGHPIPIVFLDASEEEQCVPVRPGVIKFPQQPVSRKKLLKRGLSLAACR